MSPRRFVELDIPLPGGSTVEVSAGSEEDGLCLCIEVGRESLLDLSERLRKAADEAQALTQ